MAIHIERRQFIFALGGAAVAWPLGAAAQQSRVPVLGFLASASEARYTDTAAAVRRGLNEAGYVEKQNLLIEYRWADFQYERLPALAAELVNDNGEFQIVALASQYRLPTMMANDTFPARGGLISYAADVRDLNRQAGVYVARILRGEKPADLPVVQPTTFALRVNLRTANALGLSIPESFLLLANEIIE